MKHCKSSHIKHPMERAFWIIEGDLQMSFWVTLHTFIVPFSPGSLFFNNVHPNGSTLLVLCWDQYLICTFVAESYAPVDPKYEACKPKNCGSGPNLSYPFYIYDNETDFCGYPGFGILCEENKPLFTTSRNDYFIETISHEIQSFRLVNVEVVNTLCVAPQHYFAFDSSSSNLPPSLLILFYFIIAKNGYLLVKHILQSLVLPLPQIILLPFWTLGLRIGTVLKWLKRWPVRGKWAHQWIWRKGSIVKQWRLWIAWSYWRMDLAFNGLVLTALSAN